MPVTFDQFVTLANANEGVVSIILFVIALILGWTSGIFSALRRKPKFRIRKIEGPTFFTTFGTGEKHGLYDVHRTGIALYLSVANVGASPASIDAIHVGYRWAISLFQPLWWRYGLHRFWLYNQSIILSDFQVAIGDDTKFYPFLVQCSSMSGSSAETFLVVGRSTNGVVYFEQNDSLEPAFHARLITRPS
jgi:hypothetical protein